MCCHIHSMLILKSTQKAAVHNLVEIFLHAPRRENNYFCSGRAQAHERARKNTPMDTEKGQGLVSSAPSKHGTSAIISGSQDVDSQTAVFEIPACICFEGVIAHGSTDGCNPVLSHVLC